MDMNYRGGLWAGGGVQDGVKRGKWDKCNSIINKIYFNKVTIVLVIKIKLLLITNVQDFCKCLDFNIRVLRTAAIKPIAYFV